MTKYLYNILLCCFFIVFAVPGSTSGQAWVNCDEIKVKALVEHTSERKSNGKITFTFEELNKADNYKIFLTHIGWDKPRAGDKNGYKNLEAGFYDIYLVDKQGCSKQLNVQVK